jgi:hypothetical protein
MRHSRSTRAAQQECTCGTAGVHVRHASAMHGQAHCTEEQIGPARAQHSTARHVMCGRPVQVDEEGPV